MSRFRCRGRLWRGALLLLGLVIAAYVLFTGPRDLDRYPLGEGSPYRLPWPAGQTRLCGQSNRGVISHRGWGEYAYDFNMPVGSEVSAARGGVVTGVIGNQRLSLRASAADLSAAEALTDPPLCVPVSPFACYSDTTLLAKLSKFEA